MIMMLQYFSVGIFSPLTFSEKPEIIFLKGRNLHYAFHLISNVDHLKRGKKQKYTLNLVFKNKPFFFSSRDH